MRAEQQNAEQNEEVGPISRHPIREGWPSKPSFYKRSNCSVIERVSLSSLEGSWQFGGQLAVGSLKGSWQFGGQLEGQLAVGSLEGSWQFGG